MTAKVCKEYNSVRGSGRECNSVQGVQGHVRTCKDMELRACESRQCKYVRVSNGVYKCVRACKGV